MPISGATVDWRYTEDVAGAARDVAKDTYIVSHLVTRSAPLRKGTIKSTNPSHVARYEVGGQEVGKKLGENSRSEWKRVQKESVLKRGGKRGQSHGFALYAAQKEMAKPLSRRETMDHCPIAP